MRRSRVTPPNAACSSPWRNWASSPTASMCSGPIPPTRSGAIHEVIKEARPMSRRIHLITLGVRDMARSRAFYEAAFGLVPSSASADSTVFYQLDGVVVLTLYVMKMLRADLRLG